MNETIAPISKINDNFFNDNVLYYLKKSDIFYSQNGIWILVVKVLSFKPKNFI